MVKLTVHQKYAFRASTLVEVLISLIILLSVFAAGMSLFSQLTHASLGTRRIQVRLELRTLRAAYENRAADILENNTTAIARYNIQEQPLEGYSDRKRVAFYAYNQENNILIDSLIVILPQDENSDTL